MRSIKLARLSCWIAGHKLRPAGASLEGYKLWRCQRCGALKRGSWRPRDTAILLLALTISTTASHAGADRGVIPALYVGQWSSLDGATVLMVMQQQIIVRGTERLQICNPEKVQVIKPLLGRERLVVTCDYSSSRSDVPAFVFGPGALPGYRRKIVIMSPDENNESPISTSGPLPDGSSHSVRLGDFWKRR
jgi:hypothetical protein